MILTESELTFSWTPLTAGFGITVFLATAIFSFLIWKRNHFAKPTGALEFLRLLIVAIVCLLLGQPEWREIYTPDEKPVIAILKDASGSMATADVIDADSPGEAPGTRAVFAEELNSAADWESLSEDFEIVRQDFSAAPADSTNLGDALTEILEQESQLRGVVLISDGDWNSGSAPNLAATRLRMQQIPVFTIPIGSETKLPDLEASAFDIPTFGIAGKPIRLPFSLTSSLPRSQTTNIEIRTSEGETFSQEVTIPAMGRVQDTMLWTPQTIGDYELTLTLPTVEEEFDRENNTITAPIAIRKEELKVLVIDSFPRWEYRYLRNALERDPGVEVRCLLYHPTVDALGNGPGYLEEFPEPDLLSTFDVIFLGDIGLAPDQLSLEELRAIKQQVATQAAGLVLLPGFRGNQFSLLETELEDLFPVHLDSAQPRGWGSPTPGQFELTELGARSLLTRLEDTENANASVWSSLPGFQWYAGVLRSKAGSEVLATHSSETNQFGRIPLIVTKTYGTGKILFMGTDGAWRWRKGVEDKYHYRFWGQVARWMAYQRNMASDELMRLFYSPDRPRTGDVLTLNANVMSVGGEPLQSARVSVQIISPSGAVETIQLQPGGEEQWGLFTGTFEPSEPGKHQMIMSCVENGGRLELELNVQGSELEQTGQPIRLDVMSEIARISRGEVLPSPTPDQIMEKLSAIPEPDPIERRLRIWANPWLIGAVILLLSIFWIGRKMTGAV